MSSYRVTRCFMWKYFHPKFVHRLSNNFVLDFHQKWRLLLDKHKTLWEFEDKRWRRREQNLDFEDKVRTRTKYEQNGNIRTYWTNSGLKTYSRQNIVVLHWTGAPDLLPNAAWSCGVWTRVRRDATGVGVEQSTLIPRFSDRPRTRVSISVDIFFAFLREVQQRHKRQWRRADFEPILRSRTPLMLLPSPDPNSDLPFPRPSGHSSVVSYYGSWIFVVCAPGTFILNFTSVLTVYQDCRYCLAWYLGQMWIDFSSPYIIL